MRIGLTTAIVFALLTFGAKAEISRDFQICVETFSVSFSDATKIRRDKLVGKESYEKIVSALDAGDVRQEAFQLVRVREGGNFFLEEVEEMIFPSEYEPPGSLIVEAPGAVPPVNPPLLPLRQVASAFETKLLGSTIGAEVRTSGKKAALSLNFVQISCLGLDFYGDGIARIAMPRFEVRALKNKVQVPFNTPIILGTMSSAETKGDQNDRAVQIVFVTVTPIKE